MRLNHLRVFLAVSDCGSMRGAARRLDVTPAAVTKAIQQMERELHTQLLERKQQGVVATAAGRALLTRARVIDAELRAMTEDLAQFAGGHAGAVGIGVGPTGMQLLVPQALTLFRKRFPDARVRIIEARHPTLIPLVRDETIDLAIGLRPAPADMTGLVFRPLFRHEEVVVARKGHPMAGATSLAALTGAEWISTLPLAADDALASAFAAAGARLPPPVIECESVPGVVALLASSDMVALMPRRLLSAALLRDVLVEIPVEDRLPSVAHGVVTRKNAPPTRAAAAMVAAITSVARRLVSAGAT